MLRVDESNAPISPQRIEPNKVALLFASSFMLLAIGGGAPGLFSLELSLIAGGLSLPFFGLALSQCKKSEGASQPLPCTFAQFHLAFTGKNYRLVLREDDPSLDIPLDPEKLGDPVSFEEYRSKLAFCVQARVVEVGLYPPYRELTPKCIIGSDQLPIQPNTNTLDELLLTIVPSVQQLGHMYGMAKQDTSPPPPETLAATEEETFAFLKSSCDKDITWMWYELENRRFTLWWPVSSIQRYRDMVVPSLTQNFKECVGNHWWEMTPWELWKNVTFCQLKTFPEPSSLDLLPHDFFNKKMDEQTFNNLTKLYAERLFPAILQAIRINLRKMLDEERFYKHICSFKSVGVVFPKNGSTENMWPYNYAHSTYAQWRHEFVLEISGHFDRLQVSTLRELHASLLNFSMQIDGVTSEIQLTPAQFPLPANADAPTHISLIIDWLPHFEAAILKVKPAEAHAKS